MGASLRCPLCLCTLRNTPILLPCIHAFCHECINAHFDSKSKNSKKCPVCKLPASKRSIRPSPHLKDLVQGYKSTLRSFGLVPVVYDKAANINMTQIPTSYDNDENQLSSSEMKEHLQVSRAWMHELQKCDSAQDKEMDWVREHQKKVVQVDENAILNLSRTKEVKNEPQKRKTDVVNNDEVHHDSEKKAKVVEFNLEKEDIVQAPSRTSDSIISASSAVAKSHSSTIKNVTKKSMVVTPNSNDLEKKKMESENDNQINANKNHQLKLNEEDKTQQKLNADLNSAQPEILEKVRDLKVCVKDKVIIAPKVKPKEQTLTTPNKNAQTNGNDNVLNRGNKAMESYTPGTVVSVLPRTWPGSNKPGGVARITHSFPNDNNYHVTYVLGGKEKHVSGEYIKAVDDGQDEYLSPRRGIVKMENGVKSVLGKRRRKSVIKVEINGKENSAVKKKSIKTEKDRKSFEKNKVIRDENPKKKEELINVEKPKQTADEARESTERMYAEKLAKAVKSGVVYILMSSVTDYVLSLVDVLSSEMKKKGILIKVMKDITPTKAPTLCITSSSSENPTTSATRTLKMMRCVLRCIPIVNPLWLTSSIEKGTLLFPTENKYIKTLPTKREIQRAGNAICNYVFYKKRLFENIQVVVCGGWTKGAKKSDIMVLLKECGAILLSNTKNVIFNNPLILLCDDSVNSVSPSLFKATKHALTHFQSNEISVVGGSWLFDCVSCGLILEGKEYAPKGKKAKDLWCQIHDD